MSTRHFIVATAGHVDHGKSALVKALTGTDPDRLPEEKARGITIDLGFAHLELPAAKDSGNANSPSTYSLGIVDVPGHEDFVKNMVVGVGSIDLALFIVAADDGWMPQTEEHLQILTYLGVTQAVVALTKIDLAPADSDKAEAIDHVRQKLAASPFAGAPIVPTSIVSGTGFDELKNVLARILADLPPPRDIAKPRLPVDRVFVLRGIGTVVTGTLIGGSFHRGQPAVIQPSGRSTRVRSLQSHNREVESSAPGTRTALNLPDVPKHSDQDATGVRRGDVITLADLGGPSDTLDVLVEKSPRLAGIEDGPGRPIKNGALIRVHHGSSNFTARIYLSEGTHLRAGERAVAQVRADQPVFVFGGDHFILRDWSEESTLGGGIVLNPDGSRKMFRKEAYRAFLKTRAESVTDISAWIRSQLGYDGALKTTALLLKSRFSAAELSLAIQELTRTGQAVSAGAWVADAEWWNSLRSRAMAAIDAEHKARPQLAGLPLSELRNVLKLPTPELFDLLTADLARNGFTQTGVAIRRSTHRPALPPQLEAAGAKLRATLSAKPMEPPSRKEAAPDPKAQQALRFLIETGEAVELGDEVVLLAESYLKAQGIIRQFLKAHGSGTVSELRQAIGASRRIVVPLLERLDREGVTRRDGDKRVLK